MQKITTGRGPFGAFVLLGLRGLLRDHGVQDRHHPVFKLAVIVVGNNHVADAVKPLLPQLHAWECKVSNIGRSHTLK